MPDHRADPRANLEIAVQSIALKLNGEVMHDGQVDDLVFPVRGLVAIPSECMILEPDHVFLDERPLLNLLFAQLIGSVLM